MLVRTNNPNLPNNFCAVLSNKRYNLGMSNFVRITAVLEVDDQTKMMFDFRTLGLSTFLHRKECCDISKLLMWAAVESY